MVIDRRPFKNGEAVRVRTTRTNGVVAGAAAGWVGVVTPTANTIVHWHRPDDIEHITRMPGGIVRNGHGMFEVEAMPGAVLVYDSLAEALAMATQLS